MSGRVDRRLVRHADQRPAMEHSVDPVRAAWAAPYPPIESSQTSPSA
jgi:hypothetical protein